MRRAAPRQEGNGLSAEALSNVVYFFHWRCQSQGDLRN